MSFEKAGLKIGTAQEIGCRLDDVLESTSKELWRLEGAVVYLKQAVAALESIGNLVDKEMDDGAFDLETAKYIKKYLIRSQQVVTNLSIQAENNRWTTAGKVTAMETAVKVTKKFQEEEQAKLAALQAAVQRGDVVQQGNSHVVAVAGGSRPLGVHPGTPLKESRQEEAAQEEEESPKKSKSAGKVVEMKKPSKKVAGKR